MGQCDGGTTSDRDSVSAIRPADAVRAYASRIARYVGTFSTIAGAGTWCGSDCSHFVAIRGLTTTVCGEAKQLAAWGAIRRTGTREASRRLELLG